MEGFSDISETDVPVSLMMPAEGTDTTSTIEPFMKRGHAELWLTVRDGRRLLLKGLPAELRQHPEEVARLRKEYTIGLRIDHPGIARVFWFEAFPETGPVIVMEYVDGIPLSEFLKGRKREGEGNRISPDLRMRRKVAFEIAETLAYIHSSGFSHRDIKPDNILVTTRGNRPKIIDFGLGDGDDYLLYKRSLGTREYGAPEQQEAAVGDGRADVYSFGRILESLLPERRFCKLRRACMEEDPDKRISMEEVVRSLDPTAGNGGIGRMAVIIGGIIAVCGLIATLFFLFTPSSVTERPVDDKAVDTMQVAVSQDENRDEINDHAVETEVSDIETPSGQTSDTQERREPPAIKDPDPVNSVKSDNQPSANTAADLTVWIEKYNKEVDNVFRKYGPRTFEMLRDPGKDVSLKRMEECKVIAKRAEQEMQSEGLSQAQIEMVMQTYWHHYAMTMNRYDADIY